jgi:hypothetical protein
VKLVFPYGLNENEHPDINEAYKSSQNFTLSKASVSFQPRAPFDSVATATNASDIRGLMQLVKRTGSQTTLVQSGDTVYEWDGGDSFTSRGAVHASSKLRGTFWALDDLLVVTDLAKLTAVKKWDGSTFSNLTTGLAGTLYAKYGIVHQNRVWLFNITEGATDLPHVVLASEFEEPENFNSGNRSGSSGFTTGNEPFYVVAPDLRAINGVAVFHDQLVISTSEGRLFKLTGNDSTNYAFSEFYAGSAAIGAETMVNIGNDVAYMRAGGNIESLLATDTFGDVATDDLSRFIPAQVENVSDAIAVYDQSRQQVLFFLSGKVLVLFKDILPSGFSPWSVYKTEHANGFETSAAIYMRRPGTDEFTVYFGGDAGQIYDLNGSGSGDGGSADIISRRKTRYIDKQLAGLDFDRSIITGRVQYRRLAAVPMSISLEWGDTYQTSSASMTLKGPPAGDTGIYYGGTVYYGGSIYYSQGFTFADRVSSKGFSPTGKGPGFFLSVEIQSDRTFQIDEIRIPDEVPQR